MQKQFNLEGLRELSTLSHITNITNGFWEDYGLLGELDTSDDFKARLKMMYVNEKLMLSVTELAEATDSMRGPDGMQTKDDKLPHRSALAVEIADNIIRDLDLAEGIGLVDENGHNEVITVLLEKIRINADRPHKHGKQF